MTAGSTMRVPIYEHDAQAHAQILPSLAAHLPYSISLLRRIQHGIAHPTPTARVLATFPPGAGPPDDTPWLAARVDLFRGRETQVIIYSSLEKGHTSNKPIKIAATSLIAPENSGSEETSSIDHSASSSASPYIVSTFDSPQSVLDTVRDQLVSLLTYIKINQLPIYLASLSAKADSPTEKTSHNDPTSPPSPSLNNTQTSPSSSKDNANGTKTSNQAVTLIPAHSPHAFLIGSLHTALFSLLQQSGPAVFAASKSSLDGSSADPVPGLRIHRFDDPPYYKFFFQKAEFTDDTELPSGYRFHDRRGRVGVLESQLDLVQSRTHIPRSREQLRFMPGSAVYVDHGGDDDGEEEMPVAWAFLGQDGALATLHVEEGHRGRGLALALSKETMRRGLRSEGVFGARGIEGEVEGWVHTEVAQYNVASRKVMEKIGGEILSTVIWTAIEVCD